MSKSNANYYNSYFTGLDAGDEYRLSPVYEYEQYPSAYGVVDMTGNVFEWTDSRYDEEKRIVRGASFSSSSSTLLSTSSSTRQPTLPGFESGSIGFRIAVIEPIPEPSTYGVIGGALVGLLCLVRRKRRAVAAH